MTAPQKVESGRARRARFDNQKPAGNQRQYPDRHIDEEYETPAETGHAMVDQRATGELRDAGGDALNRSHDAERPPPLIAFEEDTKRGEDLGHEKGRPKPLEGPGTDQHCGGLCQTAQTGSDRKDCHADEKQPAPAIEIAQARAVQQHDSIRNAVADDE